MKRSFFTCLTSEANQITYDTTTSKDAFPSNLHLSTESSMYLLCVQCIFSHRTETMIFSLFFPRSRGWLSLDERVEALELLGAAFLTSENKQKAARYWTQALHIRLEPVMDCTLLQ